VNDNRVVELLLVMTLVVMVIAHPPGPLFVHNPAMSYVLSYPNSEIKEHQPPEKVKEK